MEKAKKYMISDEKNVKEYTKLIHEIMDGK